MIRTTLRVLRRDLGYTLVKLTSLAVGFLCALVIVVYCRDELGYDRHHSNADRIVRLVTDKIAQEGVVHTALSQSPAAAALVEDYGEVEAATRITSYDGFFSPKVPVTVGDEGFLEGRLLFVDPAILDVFDVELLEGNRETALAQPNSVMITDRLAAKYFGEESAVGRIIQVTDLQDLVVTGVFRELPENTHVRADLFAAFDNLLQAFSGTGLEGVETQWPPLFYYTYALLDDKSSIAGLSAKLDDFLTRHMGEDATDRYKAFLEPLPDIHFHSDRVMDLEEGGDVAFVYILLTVGLAVLLIASINFINLSTARSVYRAKEVGVRKVLGATRREISRRFLGEAVTLSLLALVVAAVAFALLRAPLETLTGKSLALSLPGDLTLGLGLIGLAILVGVASGLYPALVLSATPAAVGVRGALRGGGAGNIVLRRSLVAAQLALAIVLVLGTAIALLQVDFLSNRKLGLDKESVLVVPVGGGAIAEQQASFLEVVSGLPETVSVGRLSVAPGGIVPGRIFSPEGRVGVEDANCSVLFVDWDLIDSLGLELIEGRGFSRDHPTDVDNALVVNRAALDAFGWETGVGKRLEQHPREGETPTRGTVVGVVENFQLTSLRRDIEPAVIQVSEEANAFLYVRLRAGSETAGVAAIEERWRAIAPGEPFDSFFLSASYDELYSAERRLGGVLLAFSLVALLVACVGISGLVSFMIVRRTKEIGIRKIVGATARQIIGLFTKELLVLVAVASLVAWPIAFLAGRRWLAGFAHQADVSWWLFPAAALLVGLLAALPIGLQTVPAAVAHPAAALRDE